MTHLDELVAAIEGVDTDEVSREAYISKLNIYGYKENDITAMAMSYWTDYFRAHIKDLLEGADPVQSHLLNEEQLKECIEIAFEEYQNRKKDLGIDNIRKFWAP